MGEKVFWVDYSGGVNDGDVGIGYFESGQGCMWNQSELTFTVAGRIEATEGFIGGWTIDVDEISKITSNAGISLNSATPALKLIDPNSYQRVFLGKSGSDYGLTIRNEANAIIVRLDDSVKSISGWDINAASISKINANAGLTLNSTIPAVVCTDGNNYERVRLGFDGTNYGLTVKDESNNTIININDANKNISGWTVDNEKLYNTNSYISSASFISFGNAPPTTYGNFTGVWLGWSAGETAKAQLSLYTDANNYLQFDGAKVLIKAANFTLDASGNITAAGATISGAITATSGTIGGFTASATTLANSTSIILDASSKAISIKDSTFGNDGIQLQYNAGTPRIYAGNGSTQFIKFDGTNAEVRGKLTASDIQSGGTITGATLQTAATGKRFVVDQATNEAHFYGDRGDGTVEELASIGIKTEGDDDIVGFFGSYTVTSNVCAIKAQSYQTIALICKSHDDYGILSTSYGSHGVVGVSSNVSGYAGVYGGNSNSGGYGVKGESTNGYGGAFTGGKAPLLLTPSASASAPTHSAGQGSIWLTSTCVIYVNTDGGTTWQKLGSQ